MQQIPLQISRRFGRTFRFQVRRGTHCRLIFSGLNDVLFAMGGGGACLVTLLQLNMLHNCNYKMIISDCKFDSNYLSAPPLSVQANVSPRVHCLNSDLISLHLRIPNSPSPHLRSFSEKFLQLQIYLFSC
jgi:hypothetical protein